METRWGELPGLGVREGMPIESVSGLELNLDQTCLLNMSVTSMCANFCFPSVLRFP